MIPRLSRAALIASVESLAEKVCAQSAEIDLADQTFRNFAKSLDEATAEIARLKVELAARPKGRIIRNRAWTDCRDRLAIGLSGQLVRMNDSGKVLYSVDANTMGWEEVDAP